MSATVLWALRSPCNMGCQYCYFGTVAEHAGIRDQLSHGELSHFGGRDVPAAEALQFARTLTSDAVRRVFIAGGEPLLAATTLALAEILKVAGVQVVLCTNGLPLRDPTISQRIVEIGVDAVSVSLDSHDAESNDRWRTDASGAGWIGVVEGIAALRDARKGAPSPHVGVYSVVTRGNIADLVDTARFVDGLGVDYLIYQPISLDPAHRLAAELSLETRHADEPVWLPKCSRVSNLTFGCLIAGTSPCSTERCVSRRSGTCPGVSEAVICSLFSRTAVFGPARLH